MQAAIAKAFGIKPAVAERYIEEQGGDLEAAADILGWTAETRRFHRKYSAAEEAAIIRRAVVVARLQPWADKWVKPEGAGGASAASAHGGVAEFLKEASLFELDVTLAQNLTYPSLAFRGVPLQACVDLSEMLGAPIPEPLLQYAVIFQEVARKRTCTRKEVERALMQLGLPYADPCALRPFSPEIFEGHILEHADIDAVQLSEVIKHHPGRGFSAIRERKQMRNQLERIVLENPDTGEDEEVFQVATGVADFVALIMRQNTPVDVPGAASGWDAEAEERAMDAEDAAKRARAHRGKGKGKKRA